MLQLKHKELEVYKASRLLMKECYTITLLLPPEERFGLFTQIRRAALSVKLNIAEGCSRKSTTERNRFFEISRGSVNEIDAAFEAMIDVGYATDEMLKPLDQPLNKCFAMLSNMIR